MEKRRERKREKREGGREKERRKKAQERESAGEGEVRREGKERKERKIGSRRRERLEDKIVELRKKDLRAQARAYKEQKELDEKRLRNDNYEEKLRGLERMMEERERMRDLMREKHMQEKQEKTAFLLERASKDQEVLGMVEKGKITIIDFFATWCPPCRGLSMVLHKIESPEVVVKKVDVDNDNGLSDRLGIKAVPFVAIFNKSGKPFTSFSGYCDEKSLRNIIKRAMGG